MVQCYRLSLMLGVVFSLLWAPQGQAWAQSSNTKRTLGAGDTIRLYVSSHKILNKKYQINTQGQITLPYAGRVTLQGFTKRQAARFIQRRLASHYRGLFGVKVVVVSYRKIVWMRGWVKKPGKILLPLDAGIGEAISKAGGSRPGAKLSEIWIHSPKKPPTPFNLAKYFRNGKKAKTSPLPRNSVVFVPLAKSSPGEGKSSATYLRSDASTIAILGAVNQPGVFPLFYKINVLQALALAKGPRNPAGLQELMIVEPKKPARWFDLRSYFRQKKQGALPTLRPGSVLFVPTKPIGVSGRGPIRVMGRVAKPGIVRGTPFRDFPTLLAARGGPAGDADTSNINVVYSGSNFTISQRVDLKRALEEGRLDRLPPTPPGPMVVHVPPKRASSAALADSISVISLVVTIASVISSTVVLVITIQQTNQLIEATTNNNNGNTGGNNGGSGRLSKRP